MPMVQEGKNSFYTITISNMMMLPKVISSLFIEKESSIKAFNAANGTQTNLLIVTQKNENTTADNIKLSNVYTIGIVCKIIEQEKEGDNFKLLIEGMQKAQLEDIHLDEETQSLVSRVQFIKDYSDLAELPKINALIKHVIEGVTEYVSYTKDFDKNGIELIEKINSPEEICYLVAHILHLSVNEKYRVLAENNLLDKLKLVLNLVTRENAFMREERNISHQMEKEISEAQKKHFLAERIKVMQKELGDDDENDLQKLEKRIHDTPLSEEAAEKCLSEFKKLKKTQAIASEAGVIRNYLECILDLPWGKKSPNNIDMRLAEEILDHDHYGLEDVKERILEFIAVQKRTNNLRGPILCFVGSPGVGKTSLARSIAQAVGRNYVKISLGGMKDEGEIRGHRKTYVGAMPGKIVKGLVKAKTSNPLILLDEIDKLGADFRGDPSSALLEVLDPEQNSSFDDHYLEISFDLSDVLFVATANSLQDIPVPLRDRMEIIKLSGYTEEEKLAIAKNYLIPKAETNNGLRPEECHIDDDALLKIIRNYTFEAGVRGLEKEINKIIRKVVRKLVEQEEQEPTKANAPKTAKPTRGKAITEEGTSLRDTKASDKPIVCAAKNTTRKAKVLPATLEQVDKALKSEPKKTRTTKKSATAPKSALLHITSATLKDYLGPEKCSYQKLAEQDEVGVSTGMAYTDFGGDLLSIEVVRFQGNGGLKITGKLGEVMKESVETAFSQAKCIATKLKVNPDNFKKYDYHVHVPEGATPKDGPSAGAAICTALISCITDLPVNRTIAMTGEMTLTGKVLPIGGLKEKLLAAVRGGIKTVVIPEENLKDLEKLPKVVKQTLDIKPVKRIHDALQIAISSYGDYYNKHLTKESHKI